MFHRNGLLAFAPMSIKSSRLTPRGCVQPCPQVQEIASAQRNSVPAAARRRKLSAVSCAAMICTASIPSTGSAGLMLTSPESVALAASASFTEWVSGSADTSRPAIRLFQRSSRPPPMAFNLGVGFGSSLTQLPGFENKHVDIKGLRAIWSFRHHRSGGFGRGRNLLEDGREGNAEGAADRIDGRAGSSSQTAMASRSFSMHPNLQRRLPDLPTTLTATTTSTATASSTCCGRTTTGRPRSG